MHAAVPVVGVLGLGGVAATTTVSVLAANGHFQQRIDAWDTWTLANTGSESSKRKFGSDFKYHLIDADTNRNNWYWEKIYKEVYSQGTDSRRSKGFESNKIKSPQDLKNACKSNYSEDTAYLVNQESNYSSVWKYCSRISSAPKLLSTQTKTSLSEYSIGFTLYQNLLVDTSLTGNREFWKSQEEAFLSQGRPIAEPFKTLYNKGKAGLKQTESDITPLGKVCKEAYEKESSSADKNLKKMILKYCSITPNRVVN